MEVSGKEKGVTPEQELRAVAIQAAASLCAPVSPVDRQEIPQVESVLFVADVFYAYVQGGWEQALDVYAATASKEPEPEEPVEDVELREKAVEPDILAEEAAQEPPQAPAPEPRDEVEPEAEVIPLAARGTVTKEQSKASRYLHRVKLERATGILKQAAVAKTAEHKDRLREQASSAGLDDFVLPIGGVDQKLGEYLQNL